LEISLKLSFRECFLGVYVLEKIVGSDDRPSSQFGEENNEVVEFPPLCAGLEFVPIYVHDVTDRLERVKRDPNRKEKVDGRPV
jgi:hypothetical protein